MKHSKELIPKIAKQGVSNGEQSVILSVKHINHKNGINRIFFSETWIGAVGDIMANDDAGC
jgi:hypothetical protein